MTREKFAAKAPRVQVVIDGKTHDVDPKEVEDGKSLGWYLGAKQRITVDGESVDCQIGLNITVIKSKSM
jgi:hypothetical protein